MRRWVEGERGYPVNSNCASVATMRITPTVIVAIMAMSFQPGFSKPKMNAKPKTNAKVDDLHSANVNRIKLEPTVESQGNKLQRRI